MSDDLLYLSYFIDSDQLHFRYIDLFSPAWSYFTIFIMFLEVAGVLRGYEEKSEYNINFEGDNNVHASNNMDAFYQKRILWIRLI